MAEQVAQVPSIGRIVHYKLSAQDADAINRRRTSSGDLLDRASRGQWPYGAQAHIGNVAIEGDVYPMMITRVWGADAASAVNGQVFLDGNDTLWVTSVSVGETHGSFAWPVLR